MTDTTLDMVILHGRYAKDEEMNDWGFTGPILSGIAWVHWTYGGLNITFATKEAFDYAATHTAWKRGPEEHQLEVHTIDGLLPCKHDGKLAYFGDFEFQAAGWRKTKGE